MSGAHSTKWIGDVADRGQPWSFVRPRPGVTCRRRCAPAPLRALIAVTALPRQRLHAAGSNASSPLPQANAPRRSGLAPRPGGPAPTYPGPPYMGPGLYPSRLPGLCAARRTSAGHLGDWLNQHRDLPVPEQERMLRRRNPASVGSPPPTSSA